MWQKLGNVTDVGDLIDKLLEKSAHEPIDIPPLFTKPGFIDPVVRGENQGFFLFCHTMVFSGVPTLLSVPEFSDR